MEPLPLLFASCLLDHPGERTMRQLGKITASSLLRYFFNGDIVFWKNFPEPLYPVARAGLHEIDTMPSPGKIEKEGLFARKSEKKYEMAHSLIEYSQRYSWFIFSNPGVLALRNWDHLFEEKKVDVIFSRAEDGTPSDSFFAVRSEAFEDFLKQWETACKFPIPEDRELAAILESASFRTAAFERGEIVRPFEGPLEIRDLLEASVVDLSGGKPAEQTKLAFALHMMRTFGDKDGLFLDLMES